MVIYRVWTRVYKLSKMGHIIYYDYDLGDQKYAYWTGSTWEKEIIDYEGNVGGCSDLVIDSNDNPVMSYFDWTHGDLKCARKTTNTPPGKPDEPSGKILGKTGQEYSYESSTTDVDGDEVYYMFDWGDGNTSDWLGPYISGEKVVVSYAWTEKGSYLAKVKAKDIHYSESRWSDPLPISMPKNKVINTHPLILQFLGNHPRLSSLLKNLFELGLEV